MGSWPIILPIFAVGFVLGVLWHRAHAADTERRAWRSRQVRRSAHRVEVPFPLPVQQVLDHDTEYRLGRQGRERIAR